MERVDMLREKGRKQLANRPPQDGHTSHDLHDHWERRSHQEGDEVAHEIRSPSLCHESPPDEAGNERRQTHPEQDRIFEEPWQAARQTEHISTSERGVIGASVDVVDPEGVRGGDDRHWQRQNKKSTGSCRFLTRAGTKNAARTSAGSAAVWRTR